jgi:4-hydroxy-tetrahydrodipicolinate synthase
VKGGFRGIFTPLITPVAPDGAPDLDALKRLVQFQSSRNVSGFWAMGTSSEFAAFDASERAVAVEAVASAARGVPVIANVSDAGTRRAIEHGRNAASVGATAIAATPPYYFPHSQDEVEAHFRAIRDAVDLPLFVYNIPQTVRVRVELPTLFRLIRDGVVSGMKDSQNDLEYMRLVAVSVRERGDAFTLFAGTRYLIDAAVLVGADGAIPSIANAFPALCVEAYEHASAGDFRAAAALCERLARLESLALSAGSGSRNAAVLGFVKAVLAGEGVIESPRLTAPLRDLDGDAIEGVIRQVAEMEGAPAS